MKIKMTDDIEITFYEDEDNDNVKLCKKGEIFEVVRQGLEYYWCLERNLAYRCLNIIPKQDAIEVNELAE